MACTLRREHTISTTLAQYCAAVLQLFPHVCIFLHHPNHPLISLSERMKLLGLVTEPSPTHTTCGRVTPLSANEETLSRLRGPRSMDMGKVTLRSAPLSQVGDARTTKSTNAQAPLHDAGRQEMSSARGTTSGMCMCAGSCMHELQTSLRVSGVHLIALHSLTSLSSVPSCPSFDLPLILLLSRSSTLSKWVHSCRCGCEL